MRKLIAINQVIGGCLGSGVLALAFQEALKSATNFVLWVVLLVLTAIAIPASHLLWLNAPAGYRLSIVVQALQLVSLWSKVASFAVARGAYVALSCSFEPLDIRFGAGLGGASTIQIRTGAPFALSLNLVAIVFLVWLSGAMRKPSVLATPAPAEEAQPPVDGA